ncbi:ABC transporter permease subunit [Nisaea acidiphila]|uniref:ABC transporter permease subunit n=1 Tax=Nisaea acidiphila TaxID=1862145 RepID=A0A9J7AV02_9PROT|nr:ABC transporter permease subunit [Nisaea acidiphila]UUX50634.1 ABC transporter permease subunit [Nisaea acidiphila]
MLRASPYLVAAILAGPVLAGALGALVPSFGYLPVLGHADFGLDVWRRLFDWPGLGGSVLLSLASGLVTAGVSLGLAMLFLAVFFETRAFGWLRKAIAPLLAVPHAAAAFALAFLIAPSGFLARLLSPWATGWQRPPDLLIVQDELGLSLMAGLVMKEVPFLLLMALAPLAQIRAEQNMHMARALGYGRISAWFKTVVPALYPLLRLPVYAVIAYSSANIDVALILGPVAPPLLAVQVLRWSNDPELDYRLLAAAGAVLQFGVTASAIALWVGIERLLMATGRGWLESGKRTFAEGGLRVAGRTLFPALLLAAALGVVALALSAFTRVWRFPDALPRRWTFDHWQKVAETSAEPVWATIWIAAVAAGLSLALVLAMLENERRAGKRAGRPLEFLFYVPLLVPQIGFLFGLVLLAELAGLMPGGGLVAAGHVVFVLPYVYLTLSESYRRLDPAWSRLARTLGKGEGAVFWKVTLPMLLTPALAALAVGLAVSIGQYLVTRLLGAGRIDTVTTEAIALAAGGDRRLIGAWALTQAVLPILGFGLALAVPRLVWRHRRGMLGETQ